MAALMETQLATPPSGSSSAAYPRWVMLERDCTINVVEGTSCSSSTADATALAAARTSAGHPIQVSLRLASPPAASCVCVQIRDAVGKERPTVLAAHGDSLLIQVEYEGHPTTDQFVYNAGDAAAEPRRPPSLSLLPPCYYNDEEKELGLPGPLFANATGLLRRGDGDELVVAELSTMPAELFLFRSGEWRWSVKRRRISISSGGEACELPLPWDAIVVPVGDRRLCWVDRSRCGGVMLCDDVFEDSPTLRYVALPVDDPCGGPPPRCTCTRNVCATAGGVLKFVNMFRRCCGSASATSCGRSRNAYTIRTWTLRMDGGGGGGGIGMEEWVMDGVVDATELWSLDAYRHRGLPRVRPECPVVSLEEPDVIFFWLREDRHGGDGEPTVWKVMVNTRSKTIHPVSRHENGCSSQMQHHLLPSNVSCYRKKKKNAGSDGNERSKKRPRQMHTMSERAPVVAVADEPEQQLIRDGGDASGNPTAAQPSSEMFEALREIPSYGLGPADEVRAYRILISSDDDGRRLTSLSRLPKKLRKDWLLVEIKASEV